MNGNDRVIVGLVMSAHAMVHIYELSIPILVSVWLVEFDTISVLSAEFPVNAATLGVVVSAGYALFGLGALASLLGVAVLVRTGSSLRMARAVLHQPP